MLAAYVWRHPVTGKRYGLGSNRQKAFAEAHEANLAVLDILEKPRLVHRIVGQPETLGEWLEQYKEIVDKRYADDKIAKSTRDDRKQKCNTIADRIGSTLLKEVSTRTVADFLKAYEDEGKAESPEWMVHCQELAILTAQRRSDLAKMKYSDIKDGCLNVIQQKNRRTDEIGHKVAIPMELAIEGLSLQATIARTKNVVSR